MPYTIGMATYKVLQDIEAEDKFLGPLTLKQCIFAAITVVSGYLSFLFISRGIWVMAMPLLPVIVVTGFLAFPWGRDQPTEVWLLAKIRFMFKPRKRIWDQTGVQELVKITAPPTVEQFTGDNLSQTEVKSRLKALADTIDSRGWVIKGSESQPSMDVDGSSDRLIGSSTLPAVGITADEPSIDMFDSPLATNISSQLSNSSAQHIATTVSTVQDTAAAAAAGTPPPDNLWFMNQPSVVNPGQAAFGTQSTAQPQDDHLSPLFSSQPQANPTDLADLEQLKLRQANQSQSFRNHRTILPGGQAPVKTATPPVTAHPSPATIELARNNDRTIESLAREAGDGEVVVSLH